MSGASQVGRPRGRPTSGSESCLPNTSPHSPCPAANPTLLAVGVFAGEIALAKTPSASKVGRRDEWDGDGDPNNPFTPKPAPPRHSAGSE